MSWRCLRVIRWGGWVSLVLLLPPRWWSLRLLGEVIGMIHRMDPPNGGGCDGGSAAAAAAAVVGKDGDCAAYLYYAPMNDFLPWVRANHDAYGVGRKNPPTRTTHHSPPMTSWTPQYTPPPKKDYVPRGWDGDDWGGACSRSNYDRPTNIMEEEPPTWTPQYTPPPEEDDCYPSSCGWDTSAKDNGTAGLFMPTKAASSSLFTNEDGIGAELWGWNDGYTNNNASTSTTNTNESNNSGWDTLWNINDDNSVVGVAGIEQPSSDGQSTDVGQPSGAENANGREEKAVTAFQQHANAGAAAADAFYLGLTQSLDTRADSRLFHIRNFNGWIKATQIAELDSDTSSSRMLVSGGGGGGSYRMPSPLR